ncbi:hypothetical protein RRG08_038827 [Elysia crispata]|uniref:Uncharacterized protein n=1 Tax=Elysia crispata TaxID=231223 RepID=A0AAE0YSQ3_9GAST|nr:hypothetical protein RRG08_038827 [Elysia crispata]
MTTCMSPIVNQMSRYRVQRHQTWTDGHTTNILAMRPLTYRARHPTRWLGCFNDHNQIQAKTPDSLALDLDFTSFIEFLECPECVQLRETVSRTKGKGTNRVLFRATNTVGPSSSEHDSTSSQSSVYSVNIFIPSAMEGTEQKTFSSQYKDVTVIGV